MGYFLSDEEWAQYEQTINAFHDDAFQQTIIWKPTLLGLDVNGMDGNPITAAGIPLQCLVQYNHFRSWPMSKESITGQIDNESVLVFINKEYLKREGYLNADGNFQYDPGLDRFILDGVVYVDKGQSATAQTKDKTLLQFLILKREESQTGKPLY